MQGMDVSAVLYSRGPKTAVYSPHHAIQRHQSIGMASAGGGGGQGFSGGYGLFSPGGVMSPFSWDTSTSFRFDFDDLRARSNLLSLSSSIRDADEAAILQRTSEAEELEGTGPPSVVGRSCRNDDDGDKDGDEGKRKRGEGQRQKRKGVTFPGGGGGGGPDFEMKRFKLGVLRNLLANFSLEKTIEKYRNLSSKPFTVRPGDYSFDCAVSAHQLKDKLLRLTGSDRIKINDRHFMQKMQKILEHEDQEKTKKGDEERADGEYQRLRKLMQHGVISAKELQDDECLIAAQASSAASAAAAAAAAAAAVKSRRRGAKNERNRRTAETHSMHSNPRSKLRSSLRGSNSQSTINNSMTAINRKPEDQSRNTCCHLPAITSHSQSTMNNATSSSFSSFASPSPRRAASHVYQSQHGGFQSGSILSGCQDRPRRQKEMDDERKEKKTEPVRHCKRDIYKHGGDCTEREGRLSSSLPEVYILPAAAAGAAGSAGSSKRDEHPLIQQMRQEKSVKGLYELAAKISKISF